MRPRPSCKPCQPYQYFLAAILLLASSTSDASGQTSAFEVTPKTGANVVARNAGPRNAVFFRIINKQTYNNIQLALSCEMTGTVRDCSLADDSLSIPAGDTARVRVSYLTGASREGTVSLRASGREGDERGTFHVTVLQADDRRRSLNESGAPTIRGPAAATFDNAAVFVTFNPAGGTFTSSALDVEVMWCSQGAQLNANTRVIRFNALPVTTTFDYVDAGQSDCTSTAYSNGTVNLVAGPNTLSGRISDVNGVLGTGVANYTLNNPQPGPPVASVVMNPGKNLARAACVTSTVGPNAALQCGDLLVAYAMPAFRTMDVDRTLTLLYNSGTAAPTAVVMADVTLPVGTSVPDSLRATLTVNGVDLLSRPVAAAGMGSTPRRIAMAFHPPTAGLGTGGYAFTLTLTSRYGANSFATSASGDLIIIDRRDSRYGAGWAIAGAEQLFDARNNAKLLVHGDGSAAIYESLSGNKWIAPPGAYRDTLYRGTPTNRIFRQEHISGVLSLTVLAYSMTRLVSSALR